MKNGRMQEKKKEREDQIKDFQKVIWLSSQFHMHMAAVSINKISFLKVISKAFPSHVTAVVSQFVHLDETFTLATMISFSPD